MIQIKQLPLGPLQTNCYILICEESGAAAVVDPSHDGKTIAATLDDGGHQLTHILLTHAHFDHVGGLEDLMQAYPDIPVYIHADALPMLSQASMQAAMYGLNQPAITKEPDQLVNEGDQIQVGNLMLDVLYTPGHAPGHVSFYLASHKVMFSGDVLFQGSIGRTDLPGGDHGLLIDIIERKFLVLDDETHVLSGHGPATTIGRERLSNPFLQ